MSTRPTDHGAPSQRIGWIDGARGLSIAAMIVSHAGLFFGFTPQWFHTVAMRPVAPMFLVLLGLMWRPGFRRRHLQFAAGMVAAQLLALALGFAFPNILVVMALCLLAMPVASRYPDLVIGLCVTQLVFWPLPDWWTGYPIGYALPLVIVGHLLHARCDGYLRAYGRLGSKLGLELVGRWPLTFYLGHLGVLFLLEHGATVRGP